MVIKNIVELLIYLSKNRNNSIILVYILVSLLGKRIFLNKKLRRVVNMKIVNEKGKLFGLINIIDLSIIVLILLIGTVLLMKTMGKDVGPITSSENQKNITVTFRGTVRNDSQIKAVKEGDRLISSLKPLDAYVKSVTYTDLQVPISTDDGRQVYAVDPLRKEVIIKFTMKTSSGNEAIKLDAQDVAVGSRLFTLKTQLFELQGTIEAIEFN
jgi:hypothetical protein